jgi:hypothetical protein
MDHADCVVRHLEERGGFDVIVINGVEHQVRHSAALAWRALALLQEEIERDDGVPLPRNARVTPNADTPAKSPHGDFTIAQDPPDLPMGRLTSIGVPVECAYLASFGPNDWQSETLREYGIGDVEPRHPMHAEALRDHDERLFGGEDRL